MTTIIIFVSLSVFSIAVMLFLVKRRLSQIGPMTESYLADIEPVWLDVYQYFRSLLLKFWHNNAHKAEFMVIFFGKVVVKFIVRFEDVILRFLNFVWGKCKIEKNNPSHYWQTMIRHKKDLSADSNMNMSGKTEESQWKGKEEKIKDESGVKIDKPE